MRARMGEGDAVLVCFAYYHVCQNMTLCAALHRHTQMSASKMIARHGSVEAVPPPRSGCAYYSWPKVHPPFPRVLLARLLGLETQF
jgi:hypothetical protein